MARHLIVLEDSHWALALFVHLFLHLLTGQLNQKLPGEVGSELMDFSSNYIILLYATAQLILLTHLGLFEHLTKFLEL